MRSYTALRNLYGVFTQSTSTANLATADGLINDSIRAIATLRKGNWWWLETTKDVSTVASQRAYQIPNSLRKLIDLYVTVGSTIYMPDAIHDSDRWKLILASQLGESDAPRFYYREGSRVLFAPVPASSSNTITFRGRLNLRDLSIGDYTTGGILTATNASTAIVGTGTSWTSAMAGRFIRITESDTANKGDGFWYEIASVGSATTLTLTKPYEGTSISAGNAAYTIGQMSPIPESYDIAPVYRAAALYWDSKGEDKRAQKYWNLYDGGYESGRLSPDSEPGGLIGQMLQEAAEKVEGPVILPFASQSNIINPNYPQPDASGF
jgi:hypothetical protein